MRTWLSALLSSVRLGTSLRPVSSAGRFASSGREFQRAAGFRNGPPPCRAPRRRRARHAQPALGVLDAHVQPAPALKLVGSRLGPVLGKVHWRSVAGSEAGTSRHAAGTAAILAALRNAPAGSRRMGGADRKAWAWVRPNDSLHGEQNKPKLMPMRRARPNRPALGQTPLWPNTC